MPTLLVSQNSGKANFAWPLTMAHVEWWDVSNAGRKKDTCLSIFGTPNELCTMTLVHIAQ